MRKLVLGFAILIASLCHSVAQQSGISPPDPYALTEPYNIFGTIVQGWSDHSGRSLRSVTLNTAIKNLVLIIAGQSNAANNMGALFTPTNASAIDNFNINDGFPYDVAGPMLGANLSVVGPGHIGPRIADQLITNGKFDRVILAPIAIGSTSISQWGMGGTVNERLTVIMKRLAARGWVPGVPNLTFAFLWMQGETDGPAGMTQASYQTYFGQIVSTIQAAGFSGRFFVCQESYLETIYPAIRAAQAAVVDNVTIYSGGDLDTLTSSSRQSDDTHFSPTGADSAATMIYNAMHASGAPF